MKNLLINNKVYVSFERVVPFAELLQGNEEELAYYKKYKAGYFSLENGDQSIVFDREDVEFILNQLVLPGLVEVHHKKKGKGCFFGRAHVGLVLELEINDVLRIYEYYFEHEPMTEDEITQEIRVPFEEFVSKILNHIQHFQEFYKNVTGIDMSFMEERLDAVKDLYGFGPSQ